MSNAATKPRLKTSAMIASIAGDGQATRAAPFGNALVALARERSDVVGMTADLGKYTDLHIFAQAFPERYYQMGMAEQLLMGAAAGMAHEGALPFVTTYAVFAARRAYDFIHQAIAEDNLNVKIACALPGLTTGYGPSHQAAEDLALFRAMPNLTVIDPCDAVEIEQMVPAMAAHHGRAGIRVNCIAPGTVYTPMVTSRGMSEDMRQARAEVTLLGTYDEVPELVAGDLRAFFGEQA